MIGMLCMSFQVIVLTSHAITLFLGYVGCEGGSIVVVCSN